MPCEYYKLEWNGQCLQSSPMVKDSIKLDANFIPEQPWEIHSSLGNDNKIWCEVYREPKQSGGVFVLYDFEEVLMVAHACDNMSFLRGIDFFAQIVSNLRYAEDIFISNGEDD